MTDNALPTLIEPEDLLRMPDGDHYELIDGRPSEKPIGAKSDEIGGLLLTYLNNFIRPKKLGRAYPSQTGFQCFPGKPKQVRMPDASFVSAGRLPDDTSPDGYIKVAPDIAAEVASPNDTYEEVAVKVAEFKSAGVKLIWVISPETRTVLIRRANGTCEEIDDKGVLSGEDVLPGFTCSVADLFV